MGLKKTALITAGLGGVSYAAYQAVADQLIDKIFIKRQQKRVVETKYLDWINSSNVLDVKVRSFDGLKLSAYNVHNHENGRYIILLHGIYSDKSDMYGRAMEFDKLGYNLLLVDQRGAGDSQGEYCTYGVKESQDLQIWINYLIQKYPDVKICLYGVSMGAAAVMMSTAYKLPENVVCMIEDCGYSSMKEEIAHIIRKDYKIYFPYPILRMLEKKMNERFGMSFDDVSPKTCLEENEIPILFIHGEKDSFVPPQMATILYNHNKGIRKYYSVADAGHKEACIDPEYYNNLDRFISAYM
ncbi:MAG: alpha/beta hydrolase [Erysipelotrichaceae bacterium]|nr:alpha/beta hydrolase [Erysipelotrichaceae bacterium]